MDVYHFLNLFFYFEVLILFIVFFLILIHRVVAFFTRRSQKKASEAISYFLSCSLENTPIKLRKFPFQALVKELEIFDRRFIGEDWDRAKAEITKKYLLPTACKWTHSLLWHRRNFAARVFVLIPSKDNEPFVLSLIHDFSFLVRSIASKAAVKMESKKGVYEILLNMLAEAGFGRYYYADILSQGSVTILQWLVEMATQDERFHLVCLDVLALQSETLKIPFLQTAINSSDLNMKKAALKVVIRNPQMGSVDLFSDQLKSNDESIRVLACRGLATFGESTSVDFLQKSLLDTSMLVRLEAATSLKKINKIDLVNDLNLQAYVREFA